MHIMENNRFKVIIVEDVKLELKGTEEIFRHEIPNAEVIGTAMTENEFWELLKVQLPDMVLLDLGLGFFLYTFILLQPVARGLWLHSAFLLPSRNLAD